MFENTGTLENLHFSILGKSLIPVQQNSQQLALGTGISSIFFFLIKEAIEQDSPMKSIGTFTMLIILVPLTSVRTRCDIYKAQVRLPLRFKRSTGTDTGSVLT
jgi:hypothetical protein